jgi:hypothetical protein
MKTLKRRLEKMESQLLQSEKYRDCELELVVNTEDGGQFFICYPDGRREHANNIEIDELMAGDDKITVEVID